jgi:hypothetical protein
VSENAVNVVFPKGNGMNVSVLTDNRQEQVIIVTKALLS